MRKGRGRISNIGKSIRYRKDKTKSKRLYVWSETPNQIEVEIISRA